MIEIFNIKEVLDENTNEKFILFADSLFRIKDERRGFCPKFWLTRNDLDFDSSPSILYKSANINKNNDALMECVSECYVSEICEELGLPHISYYLAKYQKLDGSSEFGTLCDTFRHSDNDIEYSGRNLTTRYQQSYYDNHQGEYPEIQLNTVYEYVKELQTLYSNRLSQESVDSIKQYLLKVALIDFLTCQEDRHWENIGFITNEELGIKNLHVIPLYDNAATFLSPMEAENFNKAINLVQEKIAKGQNPKKDVIPSYCNHVSRYPWLGIKTTMVTTTPFPNDPLRLKFRTRTDKINGQTALDVFLTEISMEIINNPEFEEFYNKVKNLNIEDILSKEEINDNFAQGIKNIAINVWEYRKSQLQKVLSKLKKSGSTDNRRQENEK